MSLTKLNDQQLLDNTKSLVTKERHILTQVLRHLREIDRRRLFSDLGYQSLFEYAVKELGYSEGQAGRRIQAMRLIKEIPEVEKKVASGSISLSNLSQAQSFFRESKKDKNKPLLRPIEKLEIIEKLENRSAREGQKILVQMQPTLSLPKEKVRALTTDYDEVRFVMNETLKKQLDEVRSLLGVKGSQMSLAELIQAMADLSAMELKARKFGRRRVNGNENSLNVTAPIKQSKIGANKHDKIASSINKLDVCKSYHPQTPTLELGHQCCKKQNTIGTNKNDKIASNINMLDLSKSNHPQTPTLELEQEHQCCKKPNGRRSISKALQKEIWDRDKSACTKCGGTLNLNIDHILPVAKGGSNDLKNLRLLCFSCNQREGIRQFGLEKMKRT